MLKNYTLDGFKKVALMATLMVLVFCPIITFVCAEVLIGEIQDVLKVALLHLQQGENAAAAETLEKGLALVSNPEDKVKLRLLLGEIYFWQNEPDKAISILNEVLLYDPDFEYLLALYDGKVFGWKSRFPPQEWMEKVSKVPGLDQPDVVVPPSPFVVGLNVRAALGDTYYFGKRDPKTAVMHYEKVLAVYPDASAVGANWYRARKQLGLAHSLGNVPPGVVIDKNYFVCVPSLLVQDGRTLIDVTSICQKLDLDFDWSSESKIIRISKQGKILELQVDKKKARLNGQRIPLDVSLSIKKNHIMVPLRLVAETFGIVIIWEPIPRIVYLFTKKTATWVEHI